MDPFGVHCTFYHSLFRTITITRFVYNQHGRGLSANAKVFDVGLDKFMVSSEYRQFPAPVRCTVALESAACLLRTALRFTSNL